MKMVGIEAMNVFAGSAYLDVTKLARHRKLDMLRFDNLLMKEKTVALPFEDPVTFAVNAALPLVSALSPEQKDRIELLITCTESGIDFGKSLSTYIHDYLKLNRNCRLFEIKQACYSGTAGFQMAVNFILANTSPGAKALVISTDIARFTVVSPEDAMNADWSYAEPSVGAGAVALLISDTPHIFQVDVGANGYYGYEVMDSCRPVADSDAGDSDLSLLSYLDCYEQSYLEYQRRVIGADFVHTFDYLAFHTPFGGMVKGAHRSMMRKMVKAKAQDVELDFSQRVTPGLIYCQRVANIMGATLFLSLASTIDHGEFPLAKRVGCFSYGSGCCSEFFSGIVSSEGQQILRSLMIGDRLDRRCELTLSEYDALLMGNGILQFGTRNVKLSPTLFPKARATHQGLRRLVLTEIRDFHRKYEWLQ